MEKYFGTEFRRKRRWINDYITKFERIAWTWMNREVIMLLDEEELENNEIKCEEIKYNRRTIQKISKELKSIKMNDNLPNVNNTSHVAPV